MAQHTVFPAPRDILIWEDNDNADGLAYCQIKPMAEMAEGEGCNLPHNGLKPLLIETSNKPAKSPAFWSANTMHAWLAGKPIELPTSADEATPEQGFLAAPAQDERFHVQISSETGTAKEGISSETGTAKEGISSETGTAKEGISSETGTAKEGISSETGTAKEGMLFKTAGLDFNLPGQYQPLTIAARVNAKPSLPSFADILQTLDDYHPFGGERRLVHWQAQSSTAWVCPPDLRSRIRRAKYLRLVLATPGLFETGWRPDWLKDDLTGKPPGTEVHIRLVSACIDRWRPISGWLIERGKKPGPKPVRRLVPAGSVYFFELIDGDPAELADKLWLQSVCTDAQNQNDGFGLALWGVWKQ
ncbi:MAG: type III-B CRISPR module-associated Cmr3 family protein [Gammaproteobacteria bacterium]